ncbi:uncharacterized protein LOC105019744 isoform X2 [Esox lucius]|uniref:uncharacterized protein LOC105019744 isoform X2 n=1 Tax=Esox lucius TaxID=8010 RepID=UPI00097323B2|nr:uncharacterized protein LOC105019744 isoform X2 [Esox lucius]
MVATRDTGVLSVNCFTTLLDSLYQAIRYPNRSKTENWHTRTRDYCGYLYNVSAIKRGKKKQYFTAVLMEENESRTIMVFQTLLQERFVMAERKRTPVKLEKVVLQPNYKLSTKFTEISRFSILEDLPFKYNSGINVRVEDMSLNLAAHNVDKKNAETIKVNVTVEVIQRLQDSHCVTRAQKRLPMVKYLVGDMDGNQTTLATLVVWNHEHTVEEGKWYRVTNVSVGRSRNQITINTTPDSTLANVPSGGKCNVPPGMIDCQEFKGKIIGHLLSEEHTCPQGHPLERVNPCGRSVTCEKCPMTYISSSVKNIFRGNLSIQSDVDSLIREFHVEDRVIRKVLWEDLKSVKEVEDALVALPPVTITVLSGNVLSIAALTQDVATQKSAAHIAWTEGV